VSASLLDQLSKEFAVSPPYFDFESLSEQEKIERKKRCQQLFKMYPSQCKESKITNMECSFILLCNFMLPPQLFEQEFT